MPLFTRTSYLVTRALFVLAALLLATTGFADRVYVTNERAGTISVIDSATDSVVITAKVGNRPRGIVVAPGGKRLYVAVSHWRDGRPRSGHEAVLALDARSLQPVKEYLAGADPEVVAVSPDGKRLYLSNEDAGNASIVDAASGRVLATLVVGTEPEGVTVRPDGKVVYVACESSSTISVIDAQKKQVTANLLVDPRPRATIFSRDGSKAWVTSELGSSVARIDPASQRVVSRLRLERTDRPVGMVLMPGEKRLYVATGRGNSVLVIDAIALKIVGRIAVGNRPWYLARTADGRKLYVANNLSNTISVIDTTTNRVLKTIPGGDGPWGVAVGN